jgi:BirA family biotin operon repressor/biotin-[acetyl-CoA-carboxylase] ligase
VSAPAWRLERHARLPSSQTHVAARAAAGEPAGLVVLADGQDAGRGRTGRGWVSEVGNLHLSVLLRPDAPARDAPAFALLAAVALHEAAAAHADVRLKWPNDLMRAGAKAGGIISEAGLAGERIGSLVLGFGVNLAVAPVVPGRATAVVGAVAPEHFARSLLHALARWLDRHAAEGLAPILAAWMEAGPELGQPIAVRQGDRLLEGRYEGLAPDGALRLARDGLVLRVHAGEAE